jgi:hypothetical protein
VRGSFVSKARASIAAPIWGLVEATIRYALDHALLRGQARQMMQSALDELGVVET